MNNTVTEEQIKNDKGSFIYDVEEGFNNDVVNLPDINVLLKNVIEVLEYSNSTEMTELRLSNKERYVSTMEKKFKQFCDRYYTLFQQIIAGEDLTPLLIMLTKINKVQKGHKTMEQVEQELGKELQSRYISQNIRNKLGI